MAYRYWVGGTGTWDNTSTTHWSATSGGSGGASVPTAADSVIIDSSSGTGTITVASSGMTIYTLTMNSPTTLLVSFGVSLNVVSVFEMVGGAFNLNSGNSITCSTFVSGGTSSRSMNFGTLGTIQITGASGTVLNIPYSTNCNIIGTGDKFVLATSNPASTTGRTVNLGSSTAFSTSLPSLKCATGIDPLALNISAHTVNLAGFSGSLTAGSAIVYGDFTYPGNSMGFNLRCRSSSGTQTVNAPGTHTGVFYRESYTASTVQLTADTLWASCNLTAGYIDLNGYTFTTYSFTSSGNSIRRIAGTVGTFNLIGVGTTPTIIWNLSGSNFTITASPNINISESTGTAYRSFLGQSLTYGNLTFTGSKSIDLITSGNNTFGTVSNTCTDLVSVRLSSTSQTYVTNWNLSGSASKQLILKAYTAGSRAYISQTSGTVNVSYCSIQDINAFGGATFNAPVANGNIDLGNNVGWNFGTASIVVNLTGTTGTSATGTVDAGTISYVNVTGVQGTVSVRSVVVNSSNILSVTGVQGTGYIGALTPVTVVDVNGIQVNGRVGLVSYVTNNFVTPNGVVGSTQLGRIAIWMTIVT